MKSTDPAVIRCRVDDLTIAQLKAVCALFDRVWPTCSGPLADQAEAYRAKIAADDRSLFAVWAGNALGAVSMTFLREVRTEVGPLTVLALAGVCTGPECRGLGWGARVVRAAFADVDEGLAAVALFQTSVPDFYAKLGAREVRNRFVNTRWQAGVRGTADCPWWDAHVMIYPATFDWPLGTVDLCGPGY